MSARMKSRLWRHHLPLALLSGAAIVILYVTRPYPDVITRLSFATAWPALVLLAAALVIGPWRTLQGKAPVLSLDLRRDIGIWGGALGVVHAVIGQCEHLRGRPWLYYVYEKTQEHLVPLRHDLFGFSNYTGLFAGLLLLALLATSNDDWQRLAPVIKATGRELDVLRDRYREGIPKGTIEQQQADATMLYGVLAELGGPKLVGPARTLAPGTFWGEE